MAEPCVCVCVCVSVTQLCRNVWEQQESAARRKRLTSAPSGWTQRSQWNNRDSSWQNPTVIPDSVYCCSPFVSAPFLSTLFAKQGPTSWLHFSQSNLQTEKKRSLFWAKPPTVDKHTLKAKLLHCFVLFGWCFLFLEKIGQTDVTSRLQSLNLISFSTTQLR